MIGIMWAGEKRPNLRELFTFGGFIAAAVVLSLVPLILGGAIVEFHIWQVFSYVPMLLRVNGPGLLVPAWHRFFGSPYVFGWLYAWVARARTDRFYSFFALSLSATMGGGIL